MLGSNLRVLVSLLSAWGSSKIRWSISIISVCKVVVALDRIRFKTEVVTGSWRCVAAGGNS